MAADTRTDVADDKDERKDTPADPEAGDRDDGDKDVPPPEDPEKARLKKALAEANRKAAADRKRLEDFERAEQEKRDAKLSDDERLKKQLAEYERRVREAEAGKAAAETAALKVRRTHEIEREALAQDFDSPELVPAILADDPRIAYDADADAFAGVKEAVEKLAKKYPNLRRGGVRNAGTAPRETPRRDGPPPAARTASGRTIDPFEQELIEMGRGGRM